MISLDMQRFTRTSPHFRDCHLLLDEQADQLYAMTDPIAERIRKTGGATLRSIGHIARIQRVKDNDADYVEPLSHWTCLRNWGVDSTFSASAGDCECGNEDVGVEDRFQRRSKRSRSRSDSTPAARARLDQ